MMNENLFKGYNVNIDKSGIGVTQDISGHLAYAKSLREENRTHNRYAKKADTGFKPFCNVPDTVALDVMTKYGINIHDENIQPEEMRKFKHIMKFKYPHLMYY
jgi:hypothetical protein